MVKRWIAGAIALLTIANGAYMLIDGPGWYQRAPGASDTGPYNAHFVWDIGVAFCVAGIGLAARVWRPRYWPAALTGAAFLLGHGIIYIAGLIGGHSHYQLMEWFGIVLPSVISVWAALPDKGESYA